MTLIVCSTSAKKNLSAGCYYDIHGWSSRWWFACKHNISDARLIDVEVYLLYADCTKQAVRSPSFTGRTIPAADCFDSITLVCKQTEIIIIMSRYECCPCSSPWKGYIRYVFGIIYESLTKLSTIAIIVELLFVIN